jgi:creatinine amidohydrolase/Fe(II)-dependent formamide hydrolase-like protein
MDYYMARWMAEETGRRFAETHPEWTVVQLPPLPLGTDELPLAGSMNASGGTVYRAVCAHGNSLAKAGYKYVVVTNGHGGPRHAAGLEAACRTVSKKHGIQMITPSVLALHAIITGQRFEAVEEKLGRSLTEDEKANLVGGEHAGGWETSFMLAQNPDLVEADYASLQKCAPPALRPVAALGQRLVDWRASRGHDVSQLTEVVGSLSKGLGWLLNAHYGYGGPTVTYQGTPAVASAELGHAFRDVMADECLQIVESVTSGRRAAQDIRSIASDPPIIQPYFWSRLAGGVAALIALAWWL